MKREQILRTVERSRANRRESDPLFQYLREIAQYPLLDRQKEQEIGRELARSRRKLARLMNRLQARGTAYPDYVDECSELRKRMNQIRDRLVMANLRLVVSIAKRFRNTGLTLLDLINEGNLGLIHAAERFDYTRGCKFSTYATWWVRQAIEKAIAESGRTIRVPAHVVGHLRKIEREAIQYLAEHGTEPPLKSLCDAVRIPETKVRAYLALVPDTISLDTPVENQQGTTMVDLQTRIEYGEPVDWVFQSQVETTFQSAFRVLDSRERLIVSLRFGLSGSGPLTLEEIGSAAGITRERVRQVLNGALEKLRVDPSVRLLELGA